jgi:curli biogenesis system outer membrane secretion channel CsgG
MRKVTILFTSLVVLATVSCSTQKKVNQVDAPIEDVQARFDAEEQSLKRMVAIGRFTNETRYGKGIFFDKENNNPLEKQAADMLATKLSASGKFILLERQDFDAIKEESAMAGNNEELQQVGADYMIFGSVTEFGRKIVGDQNLFSRSKTQTVFAGVSLRLVDVSTGEVIYSEEGKGEASTSAKSVMGFGESAGFDASLSDRAISSAISKLVENIINNCMNRPWKSYFLSYDDNAVLISGGKSQGIKVGDVYEIVQKGKKVKNPQTGMMVELPGKAVGKLRIQSTGGDTPTSEYSIVTVLDGSINGDNLSDYFIREIQ